MGVDVEYYLLVGIKGDYTDFKCEESKDMCFSTNEILEKING